MRTTLAILLCLILACGGDDDDDRIDALQDDIELIKAHLGIKADPPPTDRQPGDTPPARDDGTHRIPHDHTPSDNKDPKKDDPLIQPQPPRIGRIAFESNGEIFAIDSDGTNLQNLTNHMATDQRPAWSPDGRQIAFISNRHHFEAGGETSKIYVMDANGENQRILIDMGNDNISLNDPEWSPDGGLTFHAGGEGILIGRNHPGFFIKGSKPSWSALGKIAFVKYNGQDGNEDIYVVEARGGAPIRITHNPADDSDPAWSPDGKLIAYWGAGQADKWEQQGWEIFIMNADGTNQTNITNHPGDDRAPAWSPDGRQIAFMSDRNDSFNWEIYTMNADGTNQRNITNNAQANDMYPDWKP